MVYGHGAEPKHVIIPGHETMLAVRHSNAVLELQLDGGTELVMVKDIQRHPVRGEAVHVDFLRVDMKVAIQTTVTLELLGGDHAPGVVEGGVLSQGVVELNIEALPGDIPDSLQFDASGLEMNETATLAQLTAPEGVTLLDDPDETVLATITPPTQASPTKRHSSAAPDRLSRDGKPMALRRKNAVATNPPDAPRPGKERPTASS